MAQPQLVVKGDGTADAAKLIQVVAKTTYLVPQARAGEETFSHLKDLLHLAGHQRVKQRATLQEAALRNVVGPFKVWTDGCCGIAAENGKRGAMFVNINLGEAAVGWHQDKFTRADIVGHYNYRPRSVRHQTAPLTQILSVTLSNSTSAQTARPAHRPREGRQPQLSGGHAGGRDAAQAQSSLSSKNR